MTVLGKVNSMKIPIYLCSMLILFCAGVCLAQQSVTSATLTGRIEDTRGAVVSGASVTATHLETNQPFTTTTDEEGRFRFPYLRTGAYDLKIDAQGFATITRQLTMSVGQAVELPIKVDVAGVAAQVDIGGDVPIVETV